MKKLFSTLLLCALVTALPGCAALFDKDNTPAPTRLTPLAANALPIKVLWRANTGASASSEYLRLTPAIAGNRIFTASEQGQITALNRQNGQVIWQIQSGLPISAGVTVNQRYLFAGTREGTLAAFDLSSGKLVWTAQASSEILSPPAATETRVIVKSIDGHVAAFSSNLGKKLWSSFARQPELILHSSSSPRIANGDVFVGFEDGTLTRYSLSRGRTQWKQTIANPQGIFPIERMVDLDSDPIVARHHVFAATWQGRLASVAIDDGDIRWSRPVSTYTPLAYDGSAIYLSDAKGHVQAFDAQNGKTLWQQKSLEARKLTGPALNGHYLILGDAEGWVHWINKRSGALVTRFATGSGVFATPLVDHAVTYLMTRDGQLIACQIGQ